MKFIKYFVLVSTLSTVTAQIICSYKVTLTNGTTKNIKAKMNCKPCAVHEYTIKPNKCWPVNVRSSACNCDITASVLDDKDKVIKTLTAKAKTDTSFEILEEGKANDFSIRNTSGAGAGC